MAPPQRPTPPCPSCAWPGINLFYRQRESLFGGRGWRIACSRCGMSTPWASSQEGAFRAWCHRVGEDRLVAALRSVRAWQNEVIMAWATAPNTEVRQARWRQCQVARATLERLMDGAV